VILRTEIANFPSEKSDDLLQKLDKIDGISERMFGNFEALIDLLESDDTTQI